MLVHALHVVRFLAVLAALTELVLVERNHAVQASLFRLPFRLTLPLNQNVPNLCFVGLKVLLIARKVFPELYESLLIVFVLLHHGFKLTLHFSHLRLHFSHLRLHFGHLCLLATDALVFPVVEGADEVVNGFVLLFDVGLYLFDGLLEVEEVILLVLEVLEEGEIGLLEDGVLVAYYVF